MYTFEASLWSEVSAVCLRVTEVHTQSELCQLVVRVQLEQIGHLEEHLESIPGVSLEQ